MQIVKFFEESHTYWYGPMEFEDGIYDQDVQLDSVGSRISLYKPDFEKDYWLVHKSLQKIFGSEYTSNYRKMCARFKTNMPPHEYVFKPYLSMVDYDVYDNTMKKIQDMWLYKNIMANVRGTRFHNMMEDSLYEKGTAYNDFDGKEYPVKKFDKKWDNQSYSLDLSELEDGCYLELLVFDLENKIAGQVDKVFIETIGGRRFIDVFDYKTNEKKPNKKSVNSLAPPLDHMKDSSIEIYQLQLSTYARLLSKFKFNPRNIAIDYYKKYNLEDRSLIPVTYLESEADVLITKL